MQNTELVEMDSPDFLADRRASTPATLADSGTTRAAELPPLELKRFLPPDARPASNEWLFQVVTRAVDIAVSASVLLLLSPLLVLVGIAIRLDSPGPALYRRRTTWMNRRRGQRDDVASTDRRRSQRPAAEFHQYKFRSMFIDARERFPARYAYAYTEEQLRTMPMKALLAAESGPDAQETRVSIGNDPRLTRVGRWVRRTSLDEIPNLLSVLTGEMSLVGGRPELFDLVGFYLPEHLCKFDMKPGVTGLAQVLGRGNLTFHQINAYDVEYVKYHSIKLYFWILWRTAKEVFIGRGAY